MSLSIPLRSLSVCVARIEDLGVYAWELGRNFEVEDGNLLGGGVVDCAAEDGVDDAAGVLDGDTLASAVPAGVDEVCASAAGDFTFPTVSQSCREAIGGRQCCPRVSTSSG